jgi:hypothetical protein
MLRNATAAHDALQSLQPWRKAGHWERLMDAIIAAHDVDVQVIDASIVRANLRARRLKGGSRSMSGALRGGLSTPRSSTRKAGRSN